MGEDDLVRRAQRGDRDAVEALFLSEWKPVYRQLYRAVGNRQDAEDLTQDVFVRALSAIDDYQQRSTPFAAYLAVIARNLVRDHWRRGNRAKSKLTLIDLLACAPTSPEQIVVQADGRSRVESLLESLPPDYRQVIRLRVIEGRRVNEVADLMQRSPGAIRVLQHRALEMLRAQFREGTRS